jgi:hypothetical protein
MGDMCHELRTNQTFLKDLVDAHLVYKNSVLM